MPASASAAAAAAVPDSVSDAPVANQAFKQVSCSSILIRAVDRSHCLGALARNLIYTNESFIRNSIRVPPRKI